MHGWFNREAPRCLRSLGLFDPEGLFIGDASYLFVPDNEHYEQSDVLWFDEHNHPVKAEEVDLRDQRYQQRRCYKLVSLIHVNRKLDSFFVVAARVVAGRRPECPILYELVEEVVRAIRKGFIKVPIVDRGLIDGERMGHLKQKLAIDTIVPVRTNMDLYADAIGLTRLRGFVWEPYAPPDSPAVPAKPPRVEKREAKRQQTLAKRKAEACAAAPALALPQTRLGLGRGLLSWSQCPVPLTAVVNRERDEHGQTQDWVLVTTSQRFSAAQTRSTYGLRTAIEERHRQYKRFWDLTGMHSCAFSLVVNQALFVLLAYTLAQAHLVLRQRQQLNRGVWEYTRQLLSPSLEVVAARAVFSPAKCAAPVVSTPAFRIAHHNRSFPQLAADASAEPESYSPRIMPICETLPATIARNASPPHICTHPTATAVFRPSQIDAASGHPSPASKGSPTV